jgi:hypothetical protein
MYSFPAIQMAGNEYIIKRRPKWTPPQILFLWSAGAAGLSFFTFNLE